MKAPYMVNRYSSTLSLTSALDLGGCFKATPRPLYHRERDPVSIAQEADWAPGPVWTGVENLAPTGFRSPECPARSESPHRLRHPGPIHIRDQEYIREEHWRYDWNMPSLYTKHAKTFPYCSNRLSIDHNRYIVQDNNRLYSPRFLCLYVNFFFGLSVCLAKANCGEILSWSDVRLHVKYHFCPILTKIAMYLETLVKPQNMEFHANPAGGSRAGLYWQS